MSHTPGKLRIVEHRINSGFSSERTKNWRELYADRTPVVVADGYHSSLDGEVWGVRINQANAERLVACWNACHGIADPAALRRERDELLVLLKGIMCGVRRQHDGECSYTLLPECEQACLEIIRKAGDRHG